MDEPERDEKRDAAVVIQQGLPWIPRVLQMQHLTGVFCCQKKERKNSNKRIPIFSWITIYQLKRTISSTITKTTLSERPSGKKSAGTSR